MEWLQTLINGQGGPAVTLVLTFFAIAALLIASIWLFRKIAGGGALKPGRNRQPRLSVTDAAIVDEKRRLVLVRRDNVEHLVMIGGPTDIVIEQNIIRSQPAMPQPREAALAPRQEREPEAVRAARAVARQETHPAEPAIEPVEEFARAEPVAAPVAPPRVEKPARQAAVAAAVAPAVAATVAAAAIQEAPPTVVHNQEPLLEPELSELFDEPFVEPEYEAAPQPEPEPVFAPSFEHEEIRQPEPQHARAEPDFEFDLEGELERSFETRPEPARQPAPSLESALTAELDDDLDFAKLLGEEEAFQSGPAITTPEPAAARKPRRQENVDDEMQRLLDELANA